MNRLFVLCLALAAASGGSARAEDLKPEDLLPDEMLPGEEEVALPQGDAPEAPAPPTSTPAAPAAADLLPKLAEALKNPATAAGAVREIGPQIAGVDGAKQIVYAGAKFGKQFPDLRAACKEALIKMTSLPEVLQYLFAIRKDPRADSMAYALAYEVLGEIHLEDGPPPSPGAASPFDQRRDALLEGLKSTYTPIVMSSAVAIGNTGDKEAVKAMIDRLGSASGEVAGALQSSLGKVTGQYQTNAKAWQKWYNESGYASFPEPYAETVGGEGNGDMEAWEAEYYGIPIQSAKLSFVIDVSESMSPVKNPDPSWLPRARLSGPDPAQNPKNWSEETRTFESKLQFAKYELIATLLQLPSATRFNISFFGGTQAFPHPADGSLTEATPANKAQAIERVLQQGIAVGTPLIEGLEVAWRNPEVETIFLLSDGRPYNSRVMDPNEVVRITQQQCAGARKIVMNTIDMNEIPWSRGNGKWRKATPMTTMVELARATGGKCVKFTNLTVRTKVYKGPR